MYKILKKRTLNKSGTTVEMVVEAPLVARKCLAGQFIIFRLDKHGERVPLTIADYDREKGTVTIMFQPLGRSTKMLDMMEEGEYIMDFVGPLGKPTEIKGLSKVAVIGGGVGCAIAFPVAKRMFKKGIEVDMIAGFRNSDIVILEDEMRANSTNLYLMTDDGSYGEKGFTTDKLRQLLDGGKKYDEVIVIGPPIMMKLICDVTRLYGVKTIVSLNPVMIDGTGMCGGCRVTVGGETKFACVDGPEFDGHLVDWDSVLQRNAFYKEDEYEENQHICRITGGVRRQVEFEEDADILDLRHRPEMESHEDEEAEIKHALAELSGKKDMSPEKHPMPVQEPAVRATNFQEVALGYHADTAIEEARRCLDCKNPPCVKGCPVNVKIPEFIALVAEAKFEEAYEVVKSTNALPAVCGRVCPQENQCEGRCIRGKKGEPVAIGRLERFVADWHRMHKGEETMQEKRTSNGHKVAIVGSGPAGLSCAGDLSARGYDVTIFEAFHKAGGVLVYGIPEFRLPKSIVGEEIKTLTDNGVEVVTNAIIGRSMSIDDLFESGYEAVFIGSGAGLPRFMGIPGENFLGVYSANEYLTRINLMKAYKPGYDTPIKKNHRIAVIGGGNVAMDAARCAKRMGAEEVYIIYRRGMDELPARAEEIHHAAEEGIIFKVLTNPVSILGDEDGWVNGIECVEMELGEPDESGRRKPVEKDGSNFIIDVEAVIVSIGTSPNPLIKSTTKGLDTNQRGCIVADDSMATSREGVFAGGDAVTGAATVILAMGAGKTAAASIDEYIKNKNK